MLTVSSCSLCAALVVGRIGEVCAIPERYRSNCQRNRLVNLYPAYWCGSEPYGIAIRSCITLSVVMAENIGTFHHKGVSPWRSPTAAAGAPRVSPVTCCN